MPRNCCSSTNCMCIGIVCIFAIGYAVLATIGVRNMEYDPIFKIFAVIFLVILALFFLSLFFLGNAILNFR